MGNLFDIALDDFRTSQRSVNRYLGVWLLFAFIAYMYVIEPYFWYKADVRKTKSELDGLEKIYVLKSNKHDQIRHVFQNAEFNLKDIERQLRDYPNHLQEQIIPQINKLSFPTTACSKVGSFSPPDGTKTPGEVIIWYINTWFGNLINRLKTEVADPISELENGQPKVVQPEPNKITQVVKTDLRNFLNQEIYSIYLGSQYQKGSNLNSLYQVFVSKVQAKVKEYFLRASEQVNNHLRSVRKEIEKISNDLEIKKGEIEIKQNRKKELENQINSLESPLGRIPVRLTDIITLYPLLMIALVVMVTFNIVKTSRLYSSLRREFTKDKGDADFAVFQHHTDCWYLKAYSDITRGFFLFVPLGISIFIFGRTSWLIFKNPKLFTLLSEEAESLRRISFLSVYVIGIFVLIGCLYYILKTLRKVSREVTHEKAG